MRTYIDAGTYDPKLSAADTLLLVGLNILLVCLMSFRLVRAQKRFTSALPNSTHKVYLGIVGILIESAAPIAIFGIGIVVARLYVYKGTLGSFAGYQALTTLSILFRASGFLCAQFIIFRVATGASWANKTDTSAILSRPLEFNSPVSQTGCDEETINEAWRR